MQQELLGFPGTTFYHGLQHLNRYPHFTFVAPVLIAVLDAKYYEIKGLKNASSENSGLLCYGAVVCGRWLPTFRRKLQTLSANRDR